MDKTAEACPLNDTSGATLAHRFAADLATRGPFVTKQHIAQRVSSGNLILAIRVYGACCLDEPCLPHHAKQTTPIIQSLQDHPCPDGI